MSVLKSVGKFIVVGRTADLRSIPQKATVFDLGLLPPKTGNPPSSRNYPKLSKKRRGGWGNRRGEIFWSCVPVPGCLAFGQAFQKRRWHNCTNHQVVLRGVWLVASVVSLVLVGGFREPLLRQPQISANVAVFGIKHMSSHMKGSRTWNLELNLNLNRYLNLVGVDIWSVRV